MAEREGFVTVPVSTLNDVCDRLWRARRRLGMASEFLEGFEFGLSLLGKDHVFRIADVKTDVEFPMDDIERAVRDLELYTPEPNVSEADDDDQ